MRRPIWTRVVRHRAALGAHRRRSGRSTPPSATCDQPGALEAALDCLVENAIRFTRSGRPDPRSPAAANTADGWGVPVRDTGTGISSTHAVARLTRQRARRGHRTGTGLAWTLVRGGTGTARWPPHRHEGAQVRHHTVTLHIPQPVMEQREQREAGRCGSRSDLDLSADPPHGFKESLSVE